MSKVLQTYTTRSGETAYVVKSQKKSSDGVEQGLELVGHVDGTPASWDLSGNYDPSGADHPWDLILEVKIDL